jgi:hypothetical protein
MVLLISLFPRNFSDFLFYHAGAWSKKDCHQGLPGQDHSQEEAKTNP